jgi:hypothetical protein
MNVEFLYAPIKELDSLFKLKDADSFRLKSFFSPLGNQSVTTEEARLLWNLLSAEQIDGSQLDQLSSFPPTLAHLLVLFKNATLIKINAMKLLLETVPLVSEEIHYWEERLSSRWSILWYFLQLLPQNTPLLSRIPGLAKFMGAKRVSFSKTGSWIDKLKEFEYSSPYQVASKQINLHIRHLTRMNRVQAQCLGLMAYPAYHGSFTASYVNLEEPKEMNHHVQVLFDVSSPPEKWTQSFESLVLRLEELVIDEMNNLETIVGSLSGFEMLTVTATDKLEITEFIPIAIQKLKNFQYQVSTQHVRFSKHFEKHSRPQFVVRYWPQIASCVLATMYVYRLMTLESVVRSISGLVESSVDTAVSFVKEWLVRPVQDMLKTIRHKDSDLKIVGQNSLASDLDSLERMVIDFARDNSPQVDVRAISEQIRTGDMTSVLSEYEKEIKSPVASLVKGNLVRALLIQVQKVKVDGGFALSALDKLLKSNELNFAFLAVMPTLMITYGTVRWIRTTLGNRQGFGFGRKMDEIRLCLRLTKFM